MLFLVNKGCNSSILNKSMAKYFIINRQIAAIDNILELKFSSFFI